MRNFETASPTERLEGDRHRMETERERETAEPGTTFLESIRRVFYRSPALRAVAMALAVEVSMIGCGTKKQAEHAVVETQLPPEPAKTKNEVSKDQPSESLEAKYDTLRTYLGSHTPRFVDQRNVKKEEVSSTITMTPGMPDSEVYARNMDRIFEALRRGPSSAPVPEIKVHFNPDVSAGSLVTNDLEIQGRTMTGKHLREYMVQVFPKGWVEQEIDTIRVAENVDASLRKVTNGTTAMVCRTNPKTRASQILINPVVLKQPPEMALSYYLPHEVAHANGAFADREMTEEQRVDLLLSVIRRHQEPDRYQSEYVESISHEDPQTQLFIKADEYWAEICRAYFSDPQSLNIKDLRIVERQIRLTDPDFDVYQSMQKSHALMKDIGQSNR